MGCLWASRLWQLAQGAPQRWAEPPLKLLLRNDTSLQRWQQAGGLCLWEGETQTCLPVPAAPAEHDDERIALLLVCTKAQDTLPALTRVEAHMFSGTRIVLLQNGLRIQDEVLQQFPQQTVYCLSTSHGAYLRSPYHVVHAGQGEAWLGNLSTPGQEPEQDLLALLPQQQMRIQWERNIRSRLWDKFAVNCAINALTVIHDCNNGELLARPDAHAELRSLCEEIETLLQALPQASTCGGALYPRVCAVLQATAQNFSSTLQDARAQRTTEMPYLNEYLCELAQQEALPCPRNTELLQRFNARAAALRAGLQPRQ